MQRGKTEPLALWHGLSILLDAGVLVGRRRDELLCGERQLLSLGGNRSGLGPRGWTRTDPSPHHWAAPSLQGMCGLAKKLPFNLGWGDPAVT